MRRIQIKTCIFEAGSQKIGIHPGYSRRGDHIAKGAVDDHLLVTLGRLAFSCVDKACTKIGKVGPHRLGGGDITACRQRPRQQHRAIKKLTNFIDQAKGAGLAGMAASTSGNCNQPVDAGIRCLFRMPQINHIMEHQPAIAMNFGNQFRHRTQRSDDQRHLVFDTERQLFLDDPVCAVNNQIDPKGRRCPPHIRGDLVEARTDGHQPFLQPVQRALVFCRKRADDAGAAAGKNQIWARCQEHWRRHNRQR